jgi:hypothetical protein
VTGVVVLSNYHARDADTFAARYDVPVFLPQWLSRVAEQIESPSEYVVENIGTSGFEIRRCAPFPGWDEAIAYREADGTLYVPDVLGTAPLFTVGEERLGAYLRVLSRLKSVVKPIYSTDNARYSRLQSNSEVWDVRIRTSSRTKMRMTMRRLTDHSTASSISLRHISRRAVSDG